MTRAHKAAVLVLIASLGIWGCTQGPANVTGGANADRIKSLEGRIARLEEDFRSAAAARDQLRQKLTTAEEQRGRIQKERDLVQKERDELRQLIVIRTGERDTLLTQKDNLQNQYDQFRKNIRELLGQAEAAVNGPSQPVTSAAPITAPGKS